ncbi:MAG: chemotaxis-specific protein-glutamate methyltransferase CheB [Deltaproteobacteria bacterium]|nr:chemotaxis-specific protein-glutamate methyltransferase CheB [Deltaproteobacteria bacterium]MCB9785623.1 chemotaxis-specific protein-glutamate methyltransferase CheB [Deltaproteobacteria bacterium]
MGRTRVLVVEDSLTVRKYIVRVLTADPELEVIAEAGDGKRGIELCQSLRPDVVTLDMMLPVMSGLAATEFIMAYCPTPILIVSASLNRGEIFKTYEALAAGALDVLDKPGGGESDATWERELVANVKLLARIRVITHPRGRLGSLGLQAPEGTPPPVSTQEQRRSPRLVAIGVSTGGPAALVHILRELPADFRLPILIVIHLSALFASAFAEWLDGQSPIPVAYARHRDHLPEPGEARVLLAPPDKHLVVRGGRLLLTDDAERHSCRPSVDLLFASLADELGPSTVACLLTGMGKDGAEGLLALRRAGAHTIAQDEATSIVFGMPREAIQLGAAERVLPLGEIAPALTSLARQSPARRPA